MLWYDRGILLAGIVRAQEPSTLPQAFKRLTRHEAFPDFVQALPRDLLDRLWADGLFERDDDLIASHEGARV
jgi:hypothetical protein